MHKKHKNEADAYTNYWKHPEEGFPITIKYKIIAGNRQLSMMEDHDIVFDKYDLKIRKITEIL